MAVVFNLAYSEMEGLEQSEAKETRTPSLPIWSDIL
jgi:hypothetical protein